MLFSKLINILRKIFLAWENTERKLVKIVVGDILSYYYCYYYLKYNILVLMDVAETMELEIFSRRYFLTH